MSEFVLVPVSELKKLEESRVKLYELLESQTEDTPFLCKLTAITQSMWELANRKWPAALKKDSEPVEFEWPEYHEQGMGCGLEDRCITDRYEAMRYGWECALDRVDEILRS